MDMHTNTSSRLNSPRRRLARRQLATQIRAYATAYRTLSDQQAINLFLDQEMMTYWLGLTFHKQAVSAGDETSADRPMMPDLLRQAIAYDCQMIPKAAYATQYLMKTAECRIWKEELDEALERADELEAEVMELRAMIEQLNPQHPIRAN